MARCQAFTFWGWQAGSRIRAARGALRALATYSIGFFFFFWALAAASSAFTCLLLSANEEIYHVPFSRP
jgi:hypothetical protein